MSDFDRDDRRDDDERGRSRRRNRDDAYDDEMDRSRRDERDDRRRSRGRGGGDEDDREDRPRSRDRIDERDERGPSALPGQLRAAGWIWIIIGILILINGVLFLAMVGQAGNDKGAVVGGSCGVILIAVFGGVFIHVGMQNINGTARDTLGNGIGSILIGLLQAGAGALYLNAGHVAAAGGSFAGCAGLLIAGILALTARADFLDWKAFNNCGQRGRDRATRRSRFDGHDDRDRRDADDRRRDG